MTLIKNTILPEIKKSHYQWFFKNRNEKTINEENIINILIEIPIQVRITRKNYFKILLSRNMAKFKCKLLSPNIILLSEIIDKYGPYNENHYSN